MSVAASPAAPSLGDHLCENGFECVEILPATNDAHGGVIVDLKESMDSQDFAALLKSSLLQWTKQVVIVILNSFQMVLIAYRRVK